MICIYLLAFYASNFSQDAQFWFKTKPKISTYVRNFLLLCSWFGLFQPMPPSPPCIDIRIFFHLPSKSYIRSIFNTYYFSAYSRDGVILSYIIFNAKVKHTGYACTLYRVDKIVSFYKHTIILYSECYRCSFFFFCRDRSTCSNNT